MKGILPDKFGGYGHHLQWSRQSTKQYNRLLYLKNLKFGTWANTPMFLDAKYTSKEEDNQY